MMTETELEASFKAIREQLSMRSKARLNKVLRYWDNACDAMRGGDEDRLTLALQKARFVSEE